MSNMILLGKDNEDLDHMCSYEDEIDLHKVDYTCGCNPDCMNTESYTYPGDDFWYHHPFLWSVGRGKISREQYDREWNE